MSTNLSRKEIQKEARRRKERNQRILTFGVIGVVVAVVVLLVVLTVRPTSATLMGDEVPIASAEHVPSDAPPPPYNSNPPAGGPHYAESYEAGFFEEDDLASLQPNPEGYLVHSLEHGYVIFWYNCALSSDCEDLKQTIKSVMDGFNSEKLIAFPWSDLETPLAMTSWGRVLKLDAPDADVMRQFVNSNRYQAPEPEGH